MYNFYTSMFTGLLYTFGGILLERFFGTSNPWIFAGHGYICAFFYFASIQIHESSKRNKKLDKISSKLTKLGGILK